MLKLSVTPRALIPSKSKKDGKRNVSLPVICWLCALFSCYLVKKKNTYTTKNSGIISEELRAVCPHKTPLQEIVNNVNLQQLL